LQIFKQKNRDIDLVFWRLSPDRDIMFAAYVLPQGYQASNINEVLLGMSDDRNKLVDALCGWIRQRAIYDYDDEIDQVEQQLRDELIHNNKPSMEDRDYIYGITQLVVL
jgi:hypothetical protein